MDVFLNEMDYGVKYYYGKKKDTYDRPGFGWDGF